MLIAQRYEIGDVLGMGGMGTVFHGTDTHTNTPVAIKLLKPEIIASDSSIIERFKREGEALRQLNHPNIVKMLDALEQDGQYYLIIEYVSGGDLQDILKETPQLPIKQILVLAIELADALTRAHYLKITHRDLKPANILVAEDGTPKLTDFGVAHMASKDRVTQTGVAVGTLDYISPEVLEGHPATTRTDVWSAGVMLYEMIAGQRPFIGNNLSATITAILTQQPPDLEALRPDCPIGLVDLTYRMLEKNPDERIPSVRLIGAELEAIMQGTDTSIQLISQELPAIHFTSIDSNSIKKHNLPAQTTQFVGREDEVAQIIGMLQTKDIRLITILAPGGMGKTRLSLDVGERYYQLFPSHGVYFVELASLATVKEIIPAVAKAVNYQFQQDNRPQKQQLLDHLHNSHCVLILDNFEHIMEGASIANDILQAAPAIQIIATSREKLNLAGESIIHLEGMDFPSWETPSDALEYSAVKLFVQSATRAQAGFTLEADDLKHVARICQLVFGSPLGILLAAGWLDMLPLDEIVEQIQESLDFLETEQRDLPERQRSIRAVFEYSWNLLKVEEKEALMNISVFRGGMTRQAAQKVTGAGLRTLGALVNKSLLRRDATTGRYQTHELLREFAHEQLGDTQAIQAAHCDYFADFLKKQEADLKGEKQQTVTDAIMQDYENIRVAWLWAVQQGHADAINKMIESLYLFFNFRGFITDGTSLFTQARQKWQDDSHPLTGRLLTRFIDDSHDIMAILERALNIAMQHNDDFEIAFCQQRLGVQQAHISGNLDAGLATLEDSLKTFQRLNEHFYAAQILDDIGWVYALMGRLEDRETIVEQSLTLRRKIGDRNGVANALRGLSTTKWMKGDHQTSIQYLEEARTISIEIRDQANQAWSSSLLGMRYTLLGSIEKSPDLLAEALQIAQNINDEVVISLTQHFYVFYETLMGHIQEAEAYRKAAETFDGPNKPHSLFQYFGTLTFSTLDIELGHYEIAKRNIVEGIKNTSFGGALGLQSWVLPAVMLINVHDGYKEQAVEILGLIAAKGISNLAWAKYWNRFNDVSQQLKQELDEQVYQAAFERGKNAELLEKINRIIEN